MRSLGSTSRSPGRLLLLAPSVLSVPPSFQFVDVNPAHHERILAQLQRLRGSVYLHDGAIDVWQLTPDGRHVLDVDRLSWHVVSVHPDGRVTGCARYRTHGEDVTPEALGSWASPLAHDESWQHRLWLALEAEIALARQRNLAYVEVGGWATAEDLRFTPEAMDIALSTYALAATVGGCLGLTTATVRNCSSRMLRKLGGRALEYAGVPLPAYYDPRYRCEMELLRFDSTTPHPKYQRRIAEILVRFFNLPVVCATAAVRAASPVHLPVGAAAIMPVRQQACA